MEQLYNRRLGIQLDETSGFRLAECRFGAHAAGGGNFPEFDLLYADGRRSAVAADDPRLQVSLQREEDRLTVEYTLPGDFRAAIAYLLQEDRLAISVRVLEEAGAKLVSVGDRFFRLGKETQATARVQPPTDKGRRLRIYYMTQPSTRPPTFVCFVNRADLFHFSYQRYLENQIRETFGLEGTPVRFVIRERGDNNGR